MCAGNLPHPNDRAYYPSLIDVKNHVARAKQALQLSVIDQENAEKIIQQRCLDSPESKYFFRPYKCTQTNSTSMSVSDAESYDQTLLWVHQEPWQQKLMVSYGNTISLMDATYKTTCYDLPLFFICVRTNSGYCVVAEFIVQSESARDIEEALKILIVWNPEWNPNYFMTDFSEAEILALETSFPNTNVYLCDFHREQAWERWVKDGSHGLNSAEQDWLLNQLRACAWAPSADPEESLPSDHHYQEAVATLQSSDLWKNNRQVFTWLMNTWLSMPKVREALIVLAGLLPLF